VLDQKTVKVVNIDELKSLPKDAIAKSAKHLSASDIDFLVQNLGEKNDTVRYNAFLLLQANSADFPFMYKYWGVLDKKLASDNSYQRSLGLMLIAQNVKWDKEGKFNATINKYLACCSDEKFITSRQAIQGLASILNATNQYDDKIKRHLTNLSIKQYKENQQKLLTKDLSNVLKIIEKRQKKA